MSFGTLMLDASGDLITAEWPDGEQTVGVVSGTEQVAQAAMLAVSLHRGSVWWNISAGVDYDGLFYHANRSDAAMASVRSAAFRQSLLDVPGITGFAGANDVTFSRRGRSISVTVPCVNIACEENLASATINSMG